MKKTLSSLIILFAVIVTSCQKVNDSNNTEIEPQKPKTLLLAKQTYEDDKGNVLSYDTYTYDDKNRMISNTYYSYDVERYTMKFYYNSNGDLVKSYDGRRTTGKDSVFFHYNYKNGVLQSVTEGNNTTPTFKFEVSNGKVTKLMYGSYYQLYTYKGNNINTIENNSSVNTYIYGNKKGPFSSSGYKLYIPNIIYADDNDLTKISAVLKGSKDTSNTTFDYENYNESGYPLMSVHHFTGKPVFSYNYEYTQAK